MFRAISTELARLNPATSGIPANVTRFWIRMPPENAAKIHGSVSFTLRPSGSDSPVFGAANWTFAPYVPIPKGSASPTPLPAVIAATASLPNGPALPDSWEWSSLTELWGGVITWGDWDGLQSGTVYVETRFQAANGAHFACGELEALLAAITVSVDGGSITMATGGGD
jgi:hypothetical protein